MMQQSNSFKDLIVWQKSIVLTKEIYLLTEKLPAKESFGLTNQLRRAAVSIASNIAEGAKRGTKKDFLQFLRMANGSAAEVETQLIIVGEVYPTIECRSALDILSEVQRMLTVMVRNMK